MLSITSSENCCIIKQISSVMEFISFNTVQNTIRENPGMTRRRQRKLHLDTDYYLSAVSKAMKNYPLHKTKSATAN